MSNEIYNAFIEAGLAKEANTLSTTQEVCELSLSSRGFYSTTRVVPTIGHYIAIAEGMVIDNVMETISHLAVSTKDSPAFKSIKLRIEALSRIKEYTIELLKTEKDHQKLGKIRGLANKLVGIC